MGDPHLNICCDPSTWSTFLYTKARGPIDYGSGFIFPKVRHMNDFQGPLGFCSHGSSSVCKSTLGMTTYPYVKLWPTTQMALQWLICLIGPLDLIGI